MKRFFKITVLTSALALCAAGTASANQLLVFVTAGQIMNAVEAATGTAVGGGATVGSATTFGANCSGGLTLCGVYAVGASSAVLTSNTGTATTSVGGYSSPVPTGTAAWTAVTLAGSYQGYEVGSSANGVTQEEFITQNANTAWTGTTCATGVVGCYRGSAVSTTQWMQGVAAMNASTQIGFLLTFATQVSAGTTVNLTMDLFASQLLSTGVQGGTKNLSSTLTLNGLTTTATPEPGSIGLLFSGVAALGFAGWRRRRQAIAATVTAE